VVRFRAQKNVIFKQNCYNWLSTGNLRLSMKYASVNFTLKTHQNRLKVNTKRRQWEEITLSENGFACVFVRLRKGKPKSN
jgi:uncharacterized protein YfaT (DUF1175 family)